MNVLIDDYAFGSIPMACHGLDAECPKSAQTGAAASLPESRIARREDTNT